jgi:hypothetical protein
MGKILPVAHVLCSFSAPWFKIRMGFKPVSHPIPAKAIHLNKLGFRKSIEKMTAETGYPWPICGVLSF